MATGIHGGSAMNLSSGKTAARRARALMGANSPVLQRTLFSAVQARRRGELCSASRTHGLALEYVERLLALPTFPVGSNRWRSPAARTGKSFPARQLGTT